MGLRDASASKNLLNLRQIAPGQCGNICDTNKTRAGCFYCRTKSGELAKVFIAAVMPKHANSMTFRFNLCQDGKCVNATDHFSYGSGGGCHMNPWLPGEDLKPAPAKNTENYKMVEMRGDSRDGVDIIAIMIAQGWNLEKPLTAEMTKSSRQCSNVYWNLPEPVVVVAPQSWHTILRGAVSMEVPEEKGKVILNPNEERSRYGDLLDKYSSVDGRKVTTTPNP